MAEARQSERPPAPPSAVFGKYQLLASLGQGGMADVFLAVVRGLVGFNKLVVVKRLRSSLAEEPEFLPMFLDEARLAARLNHPNVVQTNEVGEVDGEYFIAMEYLEGQPLNRILSRSTRRKTAVPVPIYLHMLCEALAGLHHAHELKDFDGTPLNVVHRDASPHNIFVTYEGITKLVDFGIAKAATRSYETRTGVLKGKLQYMAPEQARCEDVDRRADVFSLGSVLWELLAGQRLWAGLTDLQVLEKLVSTTPATPSSVNPEVPPELERICMKALAREVDERYATAAEFREDLETYARDHARCTSRDVAAFVSKLFADKREQIRAIVERQLARAHTGADLVDINDPSTVTFSTDSLKLLSTGSHSGPRSGSDRGTPTSQAPSSDGESSGPHTASQPTRSGTPSGVAPRSTSPDADADGGGRNRKVWIAAGVVGAVAIGLFAVRQGSDEPAPPMPTPTPAAASAAAPASSPTATDDTRRAAAKTVTIRVEAKPADAKITIDDTPVPANPFEGRFPADGLTHRIVVEAKGYKTERRMVTFDEDSRATFELAKGNDEEERPRPAGPSRPYTPPAPKTSAGAAQTAPPTPAPPPTPKGPGQPTKRPLEKGDPWGN
jgi:serine/threonine protein kinase